MTREPYTVEQALADYRALTTGKMPARLGALDDAAFNTAAALLCELAQCAADAAPDDPKAFREMDTVAAELEQLLRRAR